MYNPFEKTAIKRKRLSKPMQILLNKNLLEGSILDYGCGYGEDVEILQSQGMSIEGYDKFNITYKNEYKINNKYNTITINYVFNVIPNLEEHKALLKKIKSISDNIYICVRSDKKAIRPAWKYNQENKGYWTTNNSFQRFYNEKMIDELFGEVEYISNTNSLRLFKLKHINS